MQILKSDDCRAEGIFVFVFSFWLASIIDEFDWNVNIEKKKKIDLQTVLKEIRATMYHTQYGDTIPSFPEACVAYIDTDTF